MQAVWTRRRVRRLGVAATSLLLGVTGRLSAQGNAAAAPEPSRDRAADRAPVGRVLRVQVDNDLFALRDSGPPTDYDYTHGMGGTVVWAEAPAGVRRRLGNQPGCTTAEARRSGCLMALFAVQQQIFTPASNMPAPVPGQRPHAGYLGVQLGVQQVTFWRTRSVRLDVGTTGRPTLARELQALMHAVTGSAPELGWARQLGTRPVIGVRGQDEWQADGRAIGLQARVRARYGAQLGTLRTSAAAGAEVQLAPDRPTLWTPHDGGRPLPLGPYVVGALQQELVGRDLFVDGHFGDRSVTSERVASVWQTTVGFGWRFAGGGAEFRHVRRGKQYAAQLGPHAFGTLVFSWHYP
jgi:hypothetical protein